MEKMEILERLNKLYVKFKDVENDLEELVSTPIWSEIVYDEMDDSVKVLQEIKKSTIKIVEMQMNIMHKK